MLFSNIVLQDEGVPGFYSCITSQSERNLLVCLNNATETIQYEMAGNVIHTTRDPRFHLIGLVHPPLIVQYLLAERDNSNDELMHRYLIFAPQPKCIVSSQIRGTPTPKLSLASLFLFIKLLHKVKRTYSLSREALAYFDQIFDKYSQYIRALSPTDDLIRYK